MKYVPVLELFQLSKISVQYGLNPLKCAVRMLEHFLQFVEVV